MSLSPRDDRWERGLRLSVLSALLLISACGGPSMRGVWYTVKPGDSLSAIAQERGVPLDDLIELNQLQNPSKINAGQRLYIPSARVLMSRPEGFISLRSPQPVERPEPPLDELGPAQLEGHPPIKLLRALGWPLELKTITVTSPYGPRAGRAHKGIDLRAPQGTPSLSVLPGRVSRVAYEKTGYGHYVIIDHGEGLESRYAHHHKSLVSEGAQVKAGAQIGEVGSTGLSSGPHLHFELRYRGEPLDPLIYLPAL